MNFQAQIIQEHELQLIFGDISEFINTYEIELFIKCPLDKGLPTENRNYLQNGDIFKLCVSYLKNGTAIKTVPFIG